MRNYVQLWVGRNVVPNPPGPDIISYAIEGTKDELIYSLSFAEGADIYGPVYATLDKYSLIQVYRTYLSIFLATNGYPFLKNQPGILYNGPNNNPRSGWAGQTPDGQDKFRPPQGDEHASGQAPKSDLSGAGDLIKNFFALCDAIIAELKANKKLDRLFRNRQIGIVEDIEKRVREGLLSITDALQELITDGIIT